MPEPATRALAYRLNGHAVHHELHLGDDEQAALLRTLLRRPGVEWITCFASTADHAAWAEARILPHSDHTAGGA